MLPLLYLDDGDTLAFIDSASETLTQYEAPRPAAPHRIRSKSLLETGSPYFERLFSAPKQSLFCRRRGFTKDLPAGIKFVIDLTPQATEEDEILILTEVCCPTQIRIWTRLLALLKPPAAYVGGEDEIDPGSHVRVDLPTTLTYPISQKTSELPVEYSAKRHHECIELILRALEGLDICLDTPCTVWTYSAIAKIFQIANVSLVSDPVLAWFHHNENALLVEIYPEVAYRLACGIKLPSLCMDAFKLLVGDEALLYVMSAANLSPPDSWESSARRSRISGFLDDDEVQRIEYASKSFAEKVLRDFLFIAGERMQWLEDMAFTAKLRQLAKEFPGLRTLVEDHLILQLKCYSRHIIYLVLCTAKDPRRSFQKLSSMRDEGSWSHLGQPAIVQRIMGRHFWRDLMSVNFNLVAQIYDGQAHTRIDEIGNGLAAFEGERHAIITSISRKSLDSQFRQLQMCVTHQETTGTPTSNQASSQGVAFFTLDTFMACAEECLKTFAEGVLYLHNSSDSEPRATEIISNLTDDEIRFLPLWAGGNDDGSGGVFADSDIPVMQAGGFSAPGPHVHTGSVASAHVDDEYSEINADDFQSTVQGASHHATQSHQPDILSLNSDTLSSRGSLVILNRENDLSEPPYSAHMEADDA
ncbi:hypothetical protein PDE_07969 [Penicillium oxalicum 114-2]|uniref:Uncharacterized protein n=1 Tax=Penicillium oxalicum (strain 114-2 / CGMCC 5302) TaxID=933388 RepID=S8B2F1_PENO1|nr:hypothetical protein PDE_07969 [Penicillium oxalicum 114-2]